MDQITHMLVLQRNAMHVAGDTLKAFRAEGLKMIDRSPRSDVEGLEMRSCIRDEAYEFTFAYTFKIKIESGFLIVSPCVRLSLYSFMAQEEVFILTYVPQEAKDRWFAETGTLVHDMPLLRGFFSNVLQRDGEKHFVFDTAIRVLAGHMVRLFAS